MQSSSARKEASGNSRRKEEQQSKRKGGKRYTRPAKKKRKNAFAVSLPKDYIFGVLDNLLKDLAGHLDPSQIKTLNSIIRGRDFSLYLKWTKQVAGLDRINTKYSSAPPSKAYEAAALRFLTCGSSFCFGSGGRDDKDRRFLAALNKFFEGEAICAQVNSSSMPQGYANEDLFEVRIFEKAREDIRKLLGVSPNLQQFLNNCHHGKGSSLSTQRQRTSILDKEAETPITSTLPALPFLKALLYSNDRWFRAALERHFPGRGIGSLCCTGPPRLEFGVDDRFQPVPPLVERRSWHRVGSCAPPMGTTPIEYFYGWLTKDERSSFEASLFKIAVANRLHNVPKNSDIDRLIAIEPSGNIQLQLGVGELIAKRLHAWSIDTSDQVRNKVLAAEGSTLDSLCTIDLSNASGTMSKAVVKYFLPKYWHGLLYALRSPSLDLEGVMHNYDMFSSMGNGYTFPLQTLLFSAICRAVVSEAGDRWDDVCSEFSVYGDDIVAPKQYAHDIMRSLHRMGFSVNSKKTFTDGVVRESCGVEYLRGLNIRPVTLRRTPENVCELFVHHNRIHSRFIELFGSEPSHLSRYLVKFVPQHLRFYGPPGRGETGWLFSQFPPPEYTTTYVPDWQSNIWVLRCLELKRKPARLPLALRAIFGTLSHRLKNNTTSFPFDKKPKIKKSVYTDKTLLGADVFDPLGRDCPVVINKATARFSSESCDNQTQRGWFA